MVQEEVRNYEISVWSLQDDFITVLKAANIQRKGQTEEGELKLNVDGTQELSFSIPMYIYDGIERIENPTWYSYKHGVLIANMRKIKVILNKNTKYEDVFEFLIIKVTEKHDKGELYCEVECEGLAFHELGKTGYKISLSQDDYEEEYGEWFKKQREITINAPYEINLADCERIEENYYINVEDLKIKKDTLKIYTDYDDTAQVVSGEPMQIKEIITEDDYIISFVIQDPDIDSDELKRILYLVYEHDKLEEPLNTLQYWLNKFMEPYPTDDKFIDAATWYYTIEMDWSAYTQFNGTTLMPRKNDKIYEDEYVASWKLDEDQNILSPKQVEGYKEKLRNIDAEESNKYNLTQDLAEKFGVYCKYVYEHDKNYRITARRVIFYNSFIEEDKGPIDITYKYHTSSISREMDCTDLVTKMYIKATDDDLSESGKITIMDVDANKSKEDYLLNFDYVHAVGAIDDEAYNYIEIYEKEIFCINEELIKLQNRLIALETALPKEEATLTIIINKINNAQRRKDESQQFLDNLTNGNGVLEHPPTLAHIQSDKGMYYINLTELGIISNTIKLSTTSDFSSLIPIGKFERDEFGSIIRVTNLPANSIGSSSFCYVKFSYNPRTHYDAVIATYTSILNKNNSLLKEQRNKVNDINQQILLQKKQIENKIEEKNKIIKDFELMMGPALREGYWQPEDYNDYGDKYIDNFVFPFQYQTIKGNTPWASFFWDTEPFEGEQKNYYETNVDTDNNKKYYPAIILAKQESSIWNLTKTFPIDWDTLAFLYYPDFVSATNSETKLVDKWAFPIDSESQLCFLKLKNSNKLFLVLLLTEYENIADTEQKYLEAIYSNNKEEGAPVVGHITADVNNGSLIMKEIQYLDSNYINGDTFITPGSMQDSYEIVYPRIKISSLALKNSTDQLIITYNGDKLENYTDYSIFTRLNSLIEEDDGYFITLNPLSLARRGSLQGKPLNILYTLSNANTSIYLDAIEVMKDSSQPQVSYSVDVAAVQKNYILQVHRMLNRIVHINDPELKFENIQGYVSEVTLNLDKPWEDSIEIKNYKTKFEDLFTKIVASTEAMQKQSYVAGIVSNAFSTDGSLQVNALRPVLNNLQTTYKNGDTFFSIDPARGIVFQNSEGILALRDGGLFGATQKITNYDGNSTTTDWDWKTFITPAGINMKNVMIGQIDTNNVSIFAGDKKRFQLNADGLFAYKETDRDNSIAGSPYVVLNSEGLFYRDKKENENQFIDRVEVSWNGFILRNKAGDSVFFADTEDGNLTLTGTIHAKEGWFGIDHTTPETGNNIQRGFFIGTTDSDQSGTWSFIATNPIANNATAGWDTSAHAAPCFWIGDTRFSNGEINKNLPFYITGTGVLHAKDAVIGNLTVTSNITYNTKSRAVTTDQYSDRLLYCYEMPSPFFGDIGEGVINEDGLCYISIDPIFLQTISTDQYQVYLQKYGDGDCWVLERKPSYFIIKGTPNLKFGWEIKAKQNDFDQLRLEEVSNIFSLPKHTYVEDAMYQNNN